MSIDKSIIFKDNEIENIKKYFNISKNFIECCIQRNIEYNDIKKALKNGKYFYYLNKKNEKCCKILYKKTILRVENKRLISGIVITCEKRRNAYIHNSKVDKIFETILELDNHYKNIMIDEIKKYFIITDHFSKRLVQRNIDYGDIIKTIKNGKYFYTVNKKIKCIKILYNNIILVIRNNRILTCIKITSKIKRNLFIYNEKVDFIFE